jgi:signal transduction histidine kinase
VSSNDSAERREGQVYIPILIFAIMAVGIILSGYLYYLNYKQHFRANFESQLSSIAELKVGEISMWRKERLADGANIALSIGVQSFLKKPEDPDARRRMSAWLEKFLKANQYAKVSLFDARGNPIMSAPQTPAPRTAFVAHNADEIMRSGRVAFYDFHRDAPEGSIHLDIVVPILDESDATRPLGVIIMNIDPTLYLYPFISRWPTPSQTGETLLVRKEGDDVLFLNELKFHKNAALNLRIPLTKTELPAVRAALGQTGIVEGLDYRREPVIAAVRPVPDSAWAMVARINTSEVYEPVKERLWLMVALVCVLLFGAGISMSLVWRQRSVRFYREQLKSVEALRRSESLLSSTQHLAKIGGWEYDVGTQTSFWADEVYYIHDIAPGDIVPGSDEHIARSVECYEPDDRPALLAAFARCVNEGTPYDLELPFTTVKGRKLWVRAMGHPQVGMNGKIASVIGNIMDITERKRAENELREAKEQAEAATKLKDKFVSLVAHDLRSPFTSMMGLLRLFTERKSSVEGAENQKILDRVFKSGDRMMTMIDQLLNISRLQTGKITPNPRFFKGHRAVAVTIGSLAHNAAKKGIVIINDIPLDMRLYADPSLFDEVLLNLLSNAIKFCSSGNKITIFAPPGLKSAIAVRDTGQGIDEKSISNLFRHEVQTSTLGTAGETGTGLGLPFSQDIMKAHGGELTVESAPGKGSVFCAILPHVTPVALVVDDDPDMLMILRIHLEKIGIEVISASDGEKALAAMKDRLPHIVITDIMMPVMDGFTLLDRLKRNSETSEIPVIVITSADGEIRDSAFRRGADDFVSKPIEVEDFMPRVRRFVG